MNNHRLLAGLLCVLLPGTGAVCHAQRVFTLDEIFTVAETGSAQLRTSYASEKEAQREINVSRADGFPTSPPLCRSGTTATDSRQNGIFPIIRKLLFLISAMP